MNTFQHLFSSPEWAELKRSAERFYTTLSTWLETFPQKPVSIVLVIYGVYAVYLATGYLYLNLFVIHTFFNIQNVLLLALTMVFVKLTLNRIRLLQALFNRQP